MSKKHKKTVVWVIVGIILVLIVAGVFLYSLGWRIDGSGLISPGTLVANDVSPHGLLIIDGDEKTVTAESMRIRLAQGVHTVIYAEPAMWPWAKDVHITSGEETIIAPFTVPQNTSGFTVGEPDEEYETIRNAFTNTTLLPTVDKPEISKDGTTTLFLNGADVDLRWSDTSDPPDAFCDGDGICVDTITILPSNEPVRSLTFFKGRNDVVIVSVGSSIFALDNTVSDGQNFQPIYKGVAPDFRVKSDTELYVKDGEQYYIVNY